VGGPQAVSTGRADLRTRVLMFAHLAQVALTLSSLPGRRRDEVQRDLSVLRTECDRGRMRPQVVEVVVDSVLEVVTPELPDGVARSLIEARPTTGGDDGQAEESVPGPTCLA